MAAFNPKLIGDQPLKKRRDDQFILERLVISVADALVHRAPQESYILGIEGKWGSGKSTFANFLEEEIGNQNPKHQVIRYHPWMIGDRGALSAVFLGQLAKCIDQIKREQSIRGWVSVGVGSAFNTLGSKIRKYGSYTAALASSAGHLALSDPATLAAASGLKVASSVTSLFSREKSIDDLKASIAKSLIKLNRKDPKVRITVIVDDTDRLEPAEAIEVIRLVRSVADFPIISYVLCFDREILSDQINSALKIRSGDTYIEKVFQSIVSIPPQEPFAIRRLLKRKVIEEFPNEMSRDAVSGDWNIREYFIFDIWAGRFITSPRDVARLMDSIRFGWPHSFSRADFLDFVWLQLVKLKCRGLFNWIQSYLAEVGAFRDQGTPNPRETARLAASLRVLLPEMGWADKFFESGIDHFLPGLSDIGVDSNATVLKFKSDELANFERTSRLGSPSHWRRYFSHGYISYTMLDEDIESFKVNAAQDYKKTRGILMDIARSPHSRRGHFALNLLDRLANEPARYFNKAESIGLTWVLASSMDDLEVYCGDFQRAGRSEVWDVGERLLRKLSPEYFLEAARQSPSINWLAYVARSLGSKGPNWLSPSSETDRWLDASQLRSVVQALVDRFKVLPPTKLLGGPSPLDVLFLWHQLGDTGALRDYLQGHCRVASEFLRVVEATEGWSVSSSGVSRPIRATYVNYFMDAWETHARLEKMSLQDSDEGRRAKSILKRWVSDLPKPVPPPAPTPSPPKRRRAPRKSASSRSKKGAKAAAPVKRDA